MPIPSRYLAEFYENSAYHVYNRTNNGEKLFINEENYCFFLRQYKKYLSGYLDTFGWNLLPNHFHLVFRVKSATVIRKKLETINPTNRTLTENRFLNNLCTLSKLIIHAFQRLFQSYAQSFNNWHKRKGNLFYTPFKRIQLESVEDIMRTMIYIHGNPVHHGMCKDFKTYPWSSWKSCIGELKGSMICADALKLFGNRETFIKAHDLIIDHYIENKIWNED